MSSESAGGDYIVSEIANGTALKLTLGTGFRWDYSLEDGAHLS